MTIMVCDKHGVLAIATDQSTVARNNPRKEIGCPISLATTEMFYRGHKVLAYVNMGSPKGGKVILQTILRDGMASLLIVKQHETVLAALKRVKILLYTENGCYLLETVDGELRDRDLGIGVFAFGEQSALAVELMETYEWGAEMTTEFVRNHFCKSYSHVFYLVHDRVHKVVQLLRAPDDNALLYSLSKACNQYDKEKGTLIAGKAETLVVRNYAQQKSEAT